MRIRSLVDPTQIFDGPDGPVPSGFEAVGGGIQTRGQGSDRPQIASQGPSRGIFSSPQGFFGPGIIANTLSGLTRSVISPQTVYDVGTPLLEGTLATMGPGAAGLATRGAVGVLGRAGAAGLVSGLARGAETRDWREGLKTGAYQAAAQPAGEGLFMLGRYLGSGIAKDRFAMKTARGLAQWLDNHVAAFEGTATGQSPEARLYEFAHGGGVKRLSDEFSSAVARVKTMVPETLTTPVGLRDVQMAAGALRDVPLPSTISPNGAVPINTRALIDAIPQIRALGGTAYYRILDRLNETLESVPMSGLSQTARDEFSAARRQYSIGAGWREFATRGKFLVGKRYDPVKAQAALDQAYHSTLVRRGMGEALRERIKGGPAEVASRNIRQARQHQLLAGSLGATLGGVSGHLMGAPWQLPTAGAALGLMTGMAPKFHNVPMAPLTRAARGISAYGLARAADQLLTGERTPSQ